MIINAMAADFCAIETAVIFSFRRRGYRHESASEKRNRNVYWTPAIALITGTLACGASETAKFWRRNAVPPIAWPAKNKGFGRLSFSMLWWPKTVLRTLSDKRKVSAANTEPNDIIKNPRKKTKDEEISIPKITIGEEMLCGGNCK